MVSVGLIFWPLIKLPCGDLCNEVWILQADLAPSVKSRGAEMVKGQSLLGCNSELPSWCQQYRTEQLAQGGVSFAGVKRKLFC